MYRGIDFSGAKRAGPTGVHIAGGVHLRIVDIEVGRLPFEARSFCICTIGLVSNRRRQQSSTTCPRLAYTCSQLSTNKSI